MYRRCGRYPLPPPERDTQGSHTYGKDQPPPLRGAAKRARMRRTWRWTRPHSSETSPRPRPFCAAIRLSRSPPSAHREGGVEGRPVRRSGSAGHSGRNRQGHHELRPALPGAARGDSGGAGYVSSWTVVFSVIKGLVSDGGGALSHPVIMAREFGIPCVPGAWRARRRSRPARGYGSTATRGWSIFWK